MDQDHREHKIKSQEVAERKDSPKPSGPPHICKLGAKLMLLKSTGVGTNQGSGPSHFFRAGRTE